MPKYLYECSNLDCPSGGSFSCDQSISDPALFECPRCGGPIDRVISPTAFSFPAGDSRLKDKGFVKLVRRDKGVYENVTALDHESRYYRADNPTTMPDIKLRVED